MNNVNAVKYLVICKIKSMWENVLYVTSKQVCYISDFRPLMLWKEVGYTVAMGGGVVMIACIATTNQLL